MAAKKMSLKQKSFFVLSGLSNPLGKDLAFEMCRRFEAGSLALLIETNEELLQDVKKELEYVNNGIKVICCALNSWGEGTQEFFGKILKETLESHKEKKFELAFILHNEGSLATRDLMEPQDIPEWKLYVQKHLNAPIALNRQFLSQTLLKNTEKLMVNITSSLPVQPIFFSSLHGSCLKARHMYFRALNFEEARSSRINVLSYSPGIFETHATQSDDNNNVIKLEDLNVNTKLLELPRVQPLQSALKLINILEKISFISGHDVDYYDTFVL